MLFEEKGDFDHLVSEVQQIYVRGKFLASFPGDDSCCTLPSNAAGEHTIHRGRKA